MKREFKAGALYKVEGPAFIQVLEGEIEVLGKRLRPRERLIVPKAKVSSFKVIRRSTLIVRLGEGARLEEVEQPLTPPEWEEATKRIVNGVKPAKVVVLGDVDSGKTTFTMYLANQAVSAGLKTFVIDKDLGQSDIGAPTTIGLGIVEHPVTSLSQVPMKDGYFVGITSPSGMIHRVLVGTRLLVEKALEEGADLVIINTSGWVFGRGARELKWGLILSILPEYVIALQRRGEIEHLIRPLKGFTDLEVIRLPSPVGIRERSREERRMLREASYKRHLANAKIRSFSVNQVGLMYSIYGTGIPLPKNKLLELEHILNEKVIYCENAPDGVLVVVEKIPKEVDKVIKELRNTFDKDVLLVSEGYENGILVGLLSKNGKFLGIGIVKEILYDEGIIRVLTNVEGEVGVIQFGQLKIDENGREIFRKNGWII